MKAINNPYRNLSELVEKYEAILANEGLAPLDGETLDAKFLEKRDDTLFNIQEAQKKADEELDTLLGELKCLSPDIKVQWAKGEITDKMVHAFYLDFVGNPGEFPRGYLSKEAIENLSLGWDPARCSLNI